MGVVTRLVTRVRKALGMAPVMPPKALAVPPMVTKVGPTPVRPARTVPVATAKAELLTKVPTKAQAEAILAEPLPRGRPTKEVAERREMARQVSLGLIPPGMDLTRAAKAKMEKQKAKTAKRKTA